MTPRGTSDLEPPDLSYSGLAPDPFLPSQFGNVREPRLEEKLLAAVLWSAIRDLRLSAVAGAQRQGEQSRAGVRAWFTERGSSWLYSFASICDYLEIDPDRLSSQLLAAEARNDSAALWACEERIGRLAGGNSSTLGAARMWARRSVARARRIGGRKGR